MAIKVSDYTSGGGSGGGISVTFATAMQAKEGTATHVAMNPARTKDAIDTFAASPYKLWLDDGNVGTEHDFLNWLSAIKHFNDNDERNEYFIKNPTQRFEGIIIFCNGMYQRWNGVSWINMNTFIINQNHFFLNETDKNEYFITNPTELISGTIVNVDGDFYIYINAQWKKSTAVILGRTVRDDLINAKNDQIIYTHYNSANLVTGIMRKLGINVYLKETMDYYNDLLLTTIYEKSLDGTNFDLLGMNIYNYDDEERPFSSNWWEGRASIGDQELVKVYFINGIEINEYKTWQSLCDTETLQFNTIINNPETFSIVQKSIEGNDAIFNSENAVSLLHAKGPTIIPNLTSHVSAVSASSEYETNKAWRAFNHDTDNSWITTSPTNQWISYEYNNPIWLYNITITPSSDQTSPKNCKFEYYNEDTDQWEIARSFVLRSDYAPVQNFHIAKPIHAKKWRLFIFDNYGNQSMIRIFRMQWHGYELVL